MPGGYSRGWTPMKRVDDQPGWERNPNVPPHMQAAEVWVSDRYQCLVYYLEPADPDLPKGREGAFKLSIHAHDRGPMRNWRHLQQIKNEVAGEDRTAVEVFPPEAKLTDTANEYHLWVLQPDIEPWFDMADPIVSDDEQVDRFNEEPHKGQQEPWEEGLTTGRTDASAPARERLNDLVKEGKAY